MKKQTLKKTIVAVMVAIILLLAIDVPAFAENSLYESTTGSITVSGLEVGVTAYLYQLTTVNYNDDADQPEDPTYYWVEAVRTWVSNNYSEYINTSDGSVTSAFNDEDITASAASTFYSELISAIKSKEITLSVTSSATVSGTATYPVTEDNANNKVTFSGLSMGTYLVIVENGYRVYTPVVANLVPEYSESDDEWYLNAITAECKSTNPQIEKTVTDDETSADNYSTTDTIGYTIVADIPTYLSNSLSTTYKITDTLSEGLTLDTDSIVIYGVKGSSETKLTEGTHYTFDELEEDGFTVDFDYDEISSYEQIKIEYTATLNQDGTLVLGEDGNDNDVYLTYSNNPYSKSNVKTMPTVDGPYVYTYGIKIEKTNSDKNVYLEGAEFVLKSKDEGTLYFVLVDGIYYKAKSTDENATITLVSDENGLITIYGLDEGTYYLQETKAPDDYILDTIPQTIVLVDDDTNGLLDTYDEEAEEYVNTDSAIYSITVKNISGFSLPVTGGYGTVLFVIAGIIVIIIGVVIWRRNAKEEPEK